MRIAELPDGTRLEFPDGTADEVMDRVVKSHLSPAKESPLPPLTIPRVALGTLRGIGNANIGAGEAALQGITGLGATFLGGVAGMGDTALSALGVGTNRPGDTVRYVQDALTYRPRTKQGKIATEIAGYPMNLYTQGVRATGDIIRGPEAGGVRDFLGTTFDVAGEALPVVAGGIDALQSAASRPASAPLSRKQQTLSAAQREGYVVPPSQMGQSSMTEGIGGKIRTAQTASSRNVEVTNRLAAKELGLPEGTTITVDLLKKLREDAYKTGYEPIKNFKGTITADNQFISDVLDLSKSADRVRVDFPEATIAGADAVAKVADGVLVQKMTAPGAMEYIKSLRSQARKNLAWRASPSADVEALGHAQLAAANALESLVERNLAASGQGSLVSKFREARTQIAKTHSVENALNDATGNVSARALAAGKDAGALTGGLKTAADFATGFPKANQMPELFGGTPPISPLDVSMGSALAVGGQLMSGNVGGAALGGVPLLRPFAAPMALRQSVQRGLLNNPQPLPQFGVYPYLSPLVNPYYGQDQTR